MSRCVGIIALLLLFTYLGGYAAVRSIDHADWQDARARGIDVPAVVYHHEDLHYRYLFKPVMMMDEWLTDVRFMYIPPHEEK